MLDSVTTYTSPVIQVAPRSQEITTIRFMRVGKKLVTKTEYNLFGVATKTKEDLFDTEMGISIALVRGELGWMENCEYFIPENKAWRVASIDSDVLNSFVVIARSMTEFNPKRWDILEQVACLMAQFIVIED